jgi:hypothetical protein
LSAISCWAQEETRNVASSALFISPKTGFTASGGKRKLLYGRDFNTKIGRSFLSQKRPKQS